jgi:hypothetical protein
LALKPGAYRVFERSGYRSREENASNKDSAWKFAMAQDPSQSLPPAAAESAVERKPLTPAAQRALAEAQARRLAAEANAGQAAKEFQGPKGPEPTRYGDWESKGIASDF